MRLFSILLSKSSRHCIDREVPHALFRLTSLYDVNLASNLLSGALSDDVTRLTKLRLFRSEL